MVHDDDTVGIVVVFPYYAVGPVSPLAFEIAHFLAVANIDQSLAPSLAFDAARCNNLLGSHFRPSHYNTAAHIPGMGSALGLPLAGCEPESPNFGGTYANIRP